VEPTTCVECGALLLGGEPICPGCGALTAWPGRRPAPKLPPDRLDWGKLRFLLMIGAIYTVAILLACWMWGLRGGVRFVAGTALGVSLISLWNLLRLLILTHRSHRRSRSRER